MVWGYSSSLRVISVATFLVSHWRASHRIPSNHLCTSCRTALLNYHHSISFSQSSHLLWNPLTNNSSYNFLIVTLRHFIPPLWIISLMNHLTDHLTTFHPPAPPPIIIYRKFIWIMPTFHSLAMADLKGENGKYFGYAIATPSEVIEAAPSHLANLAQWVQLLRPVCWPRAKMKISTLTIGMSLKQLMTLGAMETVRLLHISRTKLKGPFCPRIFLPADLAIIKVPEPPNWSSWRIKEPPYWYSCKECCLQMNQQPNFIMVLKSSPPDKIWKNWLVIPKNQPQKRGSSIGNLIILGSVKRTLI